MNVEQMSNEELANWMVPFTAIDDRSSGYIKSIIDEAARRLRNSIPKPVVTLEDAGDGDARVLINGESILLCTRARAKVTSEYIIDALGMEGGEDAL